jgi:nucleoside-diphosphate-sugar epimerase
MYRKIRLRHIITGGLGFTGQYLTKELCRQQKEVVVFDMAPSVGTLPAGASYIHGDIRNAADIGRIGLRPDDVVYHLAARVFHLGAPYANRDQWFQDVNVAGTRVLLDVMEAAGTKKLVFFSTDMVYGVPDTTPVPTTHPRRPLGPYGRSKRDAEDLLNQYRARGFQITIFRPRLITGPGRFGILMKLFRLIEAGLPVPLIGNGSNQYQMVSVFDCVTAALRAVELGLPPGPFHLGSRNPPTVRALLSKVIASAGSRSRLISTPAMPIKATLMVLDYCGLTLLYPEQFLIADKNYLLDLSATKRELSFEPAYGDEDMMVAAYQEYVRSRKAA